MAVFADPYWGRKALEFVDATESATRPEQVFAQFQRAIIELGFHAFIMGGVPRPGGSFKDLVLANGWPDEWFETYARDNLIAVDPVPRFAMKTLNPFEWTEVPYEPENERAARRVMERARDFRFNNGFCIPIHYEDSTACVGMAGEKPDISPKTRGVLHLMGIFAHGRIRGLSPPQNRIKKLSSREREVLAWAAFGKTAAETAEIMGISARTVTFHIVEAQRKLRTANRTATVARAITTGEIKVDL